MNTNTIDYVYVTRQLIYRNVKCNWIILKTCHCFIMSTYDNHSYMYLFGCHSCILWFMFSYETNMNMIRVWKSVRTFYLVQMLFGHLGLNTTLVWIPCVVFCYDFFTVSLLLVHVLCFVWNVYTVLWHLTIYILYYLP